MKKLYNLKKNIMSFIGGLILSIILNTYCIGRLIEAITLSASVSVIVLLIISALVSTAITIFIIIKLSINLNDYSDQLEIVSSKLDKILDLEEK